MTALEPQIKAMDALRRAVGIFIWYTGEDDPAEYPSQPVLQIDLGDSGITDEDLVHIQHFTSLEWLCLEDTPITDAGLIHLVGLKKLRQLELQNTRVSAAGVRALERELPNCEVRR